MSAITVSRQFGSEGDIVAKRVAELLNYDYVDKELIFEVARWEEHAKSRQILGTL